MNKQFFIFLLLCMVQGCKAACGSLFSALGPPRSLQSIEALYSAQGMPQGTLSCLCLQTVATKRQFAGNIMQADALGSISHACPPHLQEHVCFCVCVREREILTDSRQCRQHSSRQWGVLAS